jgi:hypothetical protein
VREACLPAKAGPEVGKTGRPKVWKSESWEECNHFSYRLFAFPAIIMYSFRLHFFLANKKTAALQ